MRIWHFQLISCLPDAMLIGQWHDCCAVARRWVEDREIKNPIVRPLQWYDPIEFLYFCRLVRNEMDERGFQVYEWEEVKLKDNIFKIYRNEFCVEQKQEHYRELMDDVWSGKSTYTSIFTNWHNASYLEICWWILYEKYSCSCISDEEWARIEERGRELV